MTDTAIRDAALEEAARLCETAADQGVENGSWDGGIEAWDAAQIIAAKIRSLKNEHQQAIQQSSEYERGLREAAKMLEMSPSTIRLHAGEMTAQEMRTVQAVLRWKIRQIRSHIES